MKVPQIDLVRQYRQLKAESKFIQRMERSNIIEQFINGNALQVKQISPRIHICEKTRDFAIYRYCRFLQSIPSTNRIGRQIRALVFDDGQRHSALMGAIGLASSIYTLGCRDRYLGWTGSSAKLLKDVGLKCLMDLAVCIAFPPYSLLLGGKLMALLAMTDPFQIEFQRKYGSPLLGLITTCATGIHCPIFNRIMIRKGGLYRRIGETKGYTTIFFGPDTLRVARKLVKDIHGTASNQLSFSSKPIRVLRQALKICNIPYEPLLRLGNPKGVYFATLSDENLISLRTGHCSAAVGSLSVEEAMNYWKSNILPKRKYSEKTIERVRRFRREELLLSKY